MRSIDDQVGSRFLRLSDEIVEAPSPHHPGHTALMDHVGRTSLASRGDSLTWNLSRVKQGNPSWRHGSTGYVTAILNESGSERAAWKWSCNDAKRFMDRHENDKQSTASINKSLREASRLREHIGEGWPLGQKTPWVVTLGTKSQKIGLRKRRLSTLRQRAWRSWERVVWTVGLCP